MRSDKPAEQWITGLHSPSSGWRSPGPAVRGRREAVASAEAPKIAHSGPLQTDMAIAARATPTRNTSDARPWLRRLESQLKALNARQTPAWMVVTINDVLFDTDRARSGRVGWRNMDSWRPEGQPERKGDDRRLYRQHRQRRPTN